MTFLKNLRDAAMACSNVDFRAMLRESADRVEHWIKTLQVDPSEETMRHLIGAWANAERVLDSVPPEGSPAPVSGSPESARLAA